MLALDEVTRHRHYPLSTHPELSVIKYTGYCEYRVENPRLVTKSGNGLQKLASSTLTFMFLVPLLAFCWQSLSGSLGYPIIALPLILTFRSIFSHLLYESVILLPPHGIQLETHRGIPGMRPLFSSKRFISAISLQDVVINEGLKGWNVLYYLVVVHSHDDGSILQVAYENLLPRHPILLEVLHGIHEIILSGPARMSIEKANVSD